METPDPTPELEFQNALSDSAKLIEQLEQRTQELRTMRLSLLRQQREEASQ